MSTAPTPTTGRLTTPPAVQSAVIGLRATGKSKRSIAKELGIARETVDNVLAVMQVAERTSADIVQTRLVPKALARIEQVIENDTDTARWTLEHTLFKPAEGQSMSFSGDASLTQVVQLMPPPSTPSLPSTTSSPTTLSTASTTDRSSREGPPSDLGLSEHGNFSQFSDAQLELAVQELARRRSATQVIEAEVVDAP